MSSVEQLPSNVGMLEWVQGGGKIALYVFRDSPLEALHDDGCEWNQPVVVQAGHRPY